MCVETATEGWHLLIWSLEGLLIRGLFTKTWHGAGNSRGIVQGQGWKLWGLVITFSLPELGDRVIWRGLRQEL